MKKPPTGPHKMASELSLCCCVLGLTLWFGVSKAANDTIVGVASVIDADTIEIHGKRIRFHGIDAPEGRQRCYVDLKPWRCGQAGALALSDFIGRRTVECIVSGKDRYRRSIAVCSVGGTDINGWLVSEGWALAYRKYSEDYISHELAAKDAKRGIWKSQFVPPWSWRRGTRIKQ